MATNKNPDAINDLLGLGSSASPKLQKASSSSKPAKAAPKAKSKLIPWSSSISEENELRLTQYMYHRPGNHKKVDVFNAALKKFFDEYPQYSDKAISDEE